MMLHSSINDANENVNVNVNVNVNANVNADVNVNDKNKINNSGSGSGSGSKPVTIILPQQYIPPVSPHHNSSSPSPLHSIHIQPALLTPAQTTKCLHLAREHAERTGCWSKGKDSDRHSSYATVDFPILGSDGECEPLERYLYEVLDFEARVLGVLADRYGLDTEDLSFMDLFCSSYRVDNHDINDDIINNNNSNSNNNNNNNNHGTTMDRLAPHRDGSLLSFTIPLSPSTTYLGGGTTFDALRDVDPALHPAYDGVLLPGGVVRVRNAGDAVLHSGKVLHGGGVG